MRDGGQHPAAPEGGRSERASQSRQGGCRVTTEHQGSAVKTSVDTGRKRCGQLKNNGTRFVSAKVTVMRCPGARPGYLPCPHEAKLLPDPSMASSRGRGKKGKPEWTEFTLEND